MASSKHGTRMCPFLNTKCVQDECELWQHVDFKVDPEWTAKNWQDIEEYQKKSWWGKLWNESPSEAWPHYIDVYGCTLSD